MYDTTLQLDPMGFAPRYSLFKMDDVLAGRADNAIKYRGIFSGLTVTGLYSFSRTGGGEVPGNYKVDRNMGVSLMYETGASLSARCTTRSRAAPSPRPTARTAAL
jgi:predicted porin